MRPGSHGVGKWDSCVAPNGVCVNFKLFGANVGFVTGRVPAAWRTWREHNHNTAR